MKINKGNHLFVFKKIWFMKVNIWFSYLKSYKLVCVHLLIGAFQVFFLYLVSEMVEFSRLAPFDLGWSCFVEETPFLIAKWVDELFRFFISESSLFLPLVTVISSILASSEAFSFFEQHLQHKPNTLSKAFSHQDVGIADTTFCEKKWNSKQIESRWFYV